MDKGKSGGGSLNVDAKNSLVWNLLTSADLDRREGGGLRRLSTKCGLFAFFLETFPKLQKLWKLTTDWLNMTNEYFPKFM